MAERFGNQPEQVIRAAHCTKSKKMSPEKHQHLESALTYAQDKNLERHAVTDERELMRDALKRSMGEAGFARGSREIRKAYRVRLT